MRAGLLSRTSGAFAPETLRGRFARATEESARKPLKRAPQKATKAARSKVKPVVKILDI